MRNRQISVLFFSASLNELWNSENLLIYQIFCIAVLVYSGFLAFLVEIFDPNFFNYPYFSWSLQLSNIAAFWPLFIYATCMAFLSATRLRSSTLDEAILGRELVSSTLAGIWEEIGFRCFYICFGMIAVIIANWVYSTFLGLVLAFVLFCVEVRLLSDKKLWLATLPVVGIGLSILLVFNANPLYWFYQSVMIPVLDVASFGYLDAVLYETAPLFVMGAIVANGKFRDGHKYQGPLGMLNAWIVGFVLLNATVTYGLLTAITIHAFYDILFSTVRYVTRKVNG